MNILITGGAGFIGSHIAPILIEYMNDVVLVDRYRRNAPNYIRADLNDYFSLERAFERVNPDVVIHLAAMVSRRECEETPVLATMTNTVGTQYIVELCKRYNARLLYAGSSEEYGTAFMNGDTPVTVDEDTPFGTPTSYYAMTKRHADEVIQYNAKDNGLVATTMRFCMLYGPDEEASEYRSAVIRFVDAARRNAPITAHRDTERSWCYIGDAVNAVLKVVYRYQRQNYEVFNIGREEPVTAIELAKKICNVFGSRSEIIEAPVEKTIIPIKRMSFERAKRVIGWEAGTSLDEGLEKIKKGLSGVPQADRI